MALKSVLSSLDGLSRHDGEGREMRVVSSDAIAVIDNDEVPVAVLSRRPRDRARHCRTNAVAVVPGEIHARMHPRIPGERIHADPVLTRDRKR